MTWLIIILILILAYIIGGLLLPSTTTIANSIKMTDSAEAIYNTIENFENWKEWEIWNADKSMRITLSNPPYGKGARYRWKSRIKEIKDGLLVLEDTMPPNQLIYHFFYGRSKRGEIHFNIQDMEDHRFVVCSITINNKRKVFGRYMGVFIKKGVMENIEDVLLKIDAYPKE